MGNFYTNVILRTIDRQAVITHMRDHGRACFVSSTSREFTTVYDRLCEDQDLDHLETLAVELSSRFHCAALAVLNHDDDVLWIGLVRDGEWITRYSSDRIWSGNAWQLAREFKAVGLLPLVWFLMRWPIVLFEVWRHSAMASVLGIPKVSVGFGYDYLSRGERPFSKNGDQFENVQ
jgi:hypothetical protein